jgi:hypothetical protein
MLYGEYDPEVEMRVVREEVLKLFEQGLSVEEIKERLQQEERIF